MNWDNFIRVDANYIYFEGKKYLIDEQTELTAEVVRWALLAMRDDYCQGSHQKLKIRLRKLLKL